MTPLTPEEIAHKKAGELLFCGPWSDAEPGKKMVNLHGQGVIAAAQHILSEIGVAAQTVGVFTLAVKVSNDVYKEKIAPRIEQYARENSPHR